MYETIEIQQIDSIATIKLNRPDSLNAFNAVLRRELLAAMQSVTADDGVRVIVLCGQGRAFCAGADLTEQIPEGQTSQDRIEEYYKPLLCCMAEAPQPIVGALQGATAGIGCGVALTCDLLVMSESAYFLQAFSAVGLIPDGGLSWYLPRLVGSKKAYELFALGEKLPAADCLQLGLVNRVVPDEELESQAHALAKQLVSRAPLSLQYAKAAMYKASTMSLADSISMEATFQSVASQSADHQEGKAAFREKRAPAWLGR
ncbi:MAG: enoyl-CoA hydratase/isomerase family protein [Granulosicoccus sp.]|nr:enoyl-CoA hydratase/isomerase family protein [Granulosicoccus sp.]